MRPGGLNRKLGPFGIREGGPQGNQGVGKPPRGENLHVGRLGGRVPFVRCVPRQGLRVVDGAEPNGCGGAAREVTGLMGRSPGLGWSTCVGKV